MAAPVYSVRFLSVSLPGVWNYWSCPGGFRAVVRCITVVVFADAAAAAYVAMGPTYLMARPYPAPTSLVLGEYRVPLYAGETMGCQVVGVDTFCSVSGYLFRDTDAQASELPAPPADPAWPAPPPFAELER